MTDAGQDVTRLLHRWSDGDRAALDTLMEILGRELRRLAASYLRQERADHTLQPTALVHEAYLRLVDQTRVDWRNRSHFFGIAAQAMRRLLVDHARRRHAGKRGGTDTVLLFDEAAGAVDLRDQSLVALDEALSDLERLDARQARVVELRYLAGLSIEETAAALDVSPATVKRDWTMARAWLRRELTRR